METQFQALPPLKRLRLMQPEEQQKKEESGRSAVSSLLPAKKRKESRLDCAVVENSVSNYILPTKKRVWAVDPELFSGKPLLAFDLNHGYNPFCDEENVGIKEKEAKPIGKDNNGMLVLTLEEDRENIDPLAKETNFESVKEPGKGEIIIAGENEEENEVEDNDIDDDFDDGDDGIVCAVCQSTDGDPSDPIVFCDGCDLMVHATCYGSPLVKAVPEGDWFCNQCLASGSLQNGNNHNDNYFSCCLCPIKNGALKPTNDGRWVHIVCSLFVPEVFFEDPVGREGINCSEIPKKRWRGRCYVCKSKSGCVIECSEMKCPLLFHVTCGLNEDLCIEYREGKKKGGIVAGFCKDHTKLWEKQQQTGKFKIVARDE